MKNLFLIALALVSLQISAQDKKDMHREGDRKERAERMSSYTAEEQAQLQTKRMTLDLDLTEAQQQKIMALNLENAKERKAMMEARKAMMGQKEAGKELSKEEKLKMKNDMLDKQIAMKQQMKTILDEKQYAKWESQQAARMKKGQEHKKRMIKEQK